MQQHCAPASPLRQAIESCKPGPHCLAIRTFFQIRSPIGLGVVAARTNVTVQISLTPTTVHTRCILCAVRLADDSS